METEKRKSGIEILGNLPWGTHFCQFYQIKEDLTSILVPYFKAGLLSNEFCMWITAEPLGVEEARNAMREALPTFDDYTNKGQIEIIPYSDWYLKDGHFDHKRVLDGWIQKLENALKKGFAGLRLTGNTFWLEKEDWNAFTDYEMEVNNVIGKYNMIAICTYSLQKCGAREILDVMKNHQFALIRNEGRWELIENANQKRMVSALKEREESLRDVEARFHGIFDNAIEGISLTSKDGHFIAVNPAFARMFGYAATDELIEKVQNARTLYVEPNRRDEFIKIMESKGIVTGFENQAQRKDGGSIWVLVNSRPFKDPMGQIVGYESFYNDITERKQAEEALRVAQERLSIATKAAKLGIFDYNLNTGMVQWDQRISEIWGVGMDEPFTYETFMAGVHPDDRESTQLAVDKALDPTRDGNYVAEYRVISRENGKTRWVRAFGQAFFKDQRAVRLIGTVEDITNRKFAEEMLRVSERKFRSAFSNAAIGFAMTTPDGYFVDANPAYCTLTGYSIDELRNMRFPQVIHPEDYSKNIELIDQMLAGQIPDFVVENRYIRKDGGTVWVRKSISLVHNEKGAPLWIIALVESVADRKRVENALEENQKDLNRAQAVGMIGNWRLDVHTNVLRWSDETYRMFGIPKGTPLTFESFLSCIHPEDKEFVDRKWKDALNGEPYDLEHRIIVDGVIKWVREKAELETDKDCKLVGGFGTVQDITRVKELQDKLTDYAKNLEKLVKERTDKLVDASRYARSLLEANLDPLVTINLEGKITDVNEATVEITGVPRTELIGSDFSDNFTEPEKAREGYKTVFVKGFVKDYPLVIRHRSGKNKHVLYNATTYKNAAGEIQGVFADARDVTELRQADQRIRQLAMLLDNAKEAITLRNLDNRILYWNKGSEMLYGWNSSEVVGKLAHEIIYKGADQDDSMPQYTLALKAVKEKGEWNGEMIHRDRHGKEIIVDSRWTLVYDDTKKPESILVMNMDITDKKRMEGQFLRAQRMESIGTLAGGIAHDLNNILTPIMLSMDFFKTSLKDKESLRMLAMVETNVKRAADMARQILSFARGVEGERQPIRIERLIAEVGRTIKETFPKSIEIRTEFPPDLGSIMGDITQLHQVLMNLCLNARDAMPFGGTLHLTAENFYIDENYTRMNVGAKEGQHVVVTVTDTGTGMPPSVLNRLFEPFFTTKKQGEGTGLGLSTAQGIVKSHGGFIHVYSEVGRGSTFKVFLPFSATNEGDLLVPRKEENFQGRGEVILVVDDEEMIRTITTTALGGNGYKVLVASDGAEAVAIYAQHMKEIKAILLDMMMPVMDGYACIKALKTINPEARIIGMSGLRQDGKLPDIAGKTNAFLAKPFTTEHMLKIIRDVLS